jgi:hypothetical protein
MLSERPAEVVAALAELGLPLETPSQDLRRAYLRVIKVRKPEVDPEGFRRAREAFDLLTRWFHDVAEAERVGPRPEAAPRADGAVLAEPSTQEAATAPLEPAPRPAPEGSPQAWSAVRPLLAEGRVSDVRAAVRALLDAGVPPPTPQGVLQLLLDLHWRDPGEEARQTLGVFLRWVERMELELAFARQPERWLLVKELAQLPETTPAEVEATVAAGLGSGDLGEAVRRLEAYARRCPKAAADALQALAPCAPFLHQALSSALGAVSHADVPGSPERPLASVPPASRRSWSGHSPGIGVLIAFSVLARLLLGPTEKVPGPSFAPTYLPRGGANPRQEAVFASVEGLCARSPRDCKAALEVRKRLDEQDCLGARREYLELSSSPTLGSTSPAQEVLRAVLLSFDTRFQFCRPK